MPYIYNADIYCDDCGKQIKDSILKHVKSFYDSGDSEDYPQRISGYNESDSPQHCGSGSDCINYMVFDGRKVGDFLENDLTTDGREYVIKTNKENPTELTGFWMEFYGFSDDTPEDEDDD